MKSKSKKLLSTLLAVMMVLLFALSLLTACSVNGGGGNNGDIVPTNISESLPQTENTAPAADSGDVVDFDVDDWVFYHWWGLDADITQLVKYSDFAGSQTLDMNMDGMYADISFKIRMEHYDNFEQTTSVDGEYILMIDSTITIDTDEAADRLLSGLLGEVLSGMELGISGELSGSYRSFFSYVDNDGNYRRPKFDDDGNYIKPDDQSDHPSTSFVLRVPENWPSLIKDTNGKTVLPVAGSYMLFENIKMEYTGFTSHALVGAFDEEVVYDLFIFVLIAPDAPGQGINVSNLNERDVKVYIDLHTVNGNHIWIEGDGLFFLNEAFFQRENN